MTYGFRRVQLDAATVDLDRMRVERGGEILPLTAMEARLVAYLAANPDRVVTREELLSEVWEYSPRTRTRTVSMTVSRLRAKIEANPAEPRHLLTVPSEGYRFVGAVLTGEANPASPPSLRGTLEDLGPSGFNSSVSGEDVWALVVVWCPSEPSRLGEVVFIPSTGKPVVFGRGDGAEEPRVQLVRQRPGRLESTPPLSDRKLSRRQLRLRDAGVHVHVVNEGRATLLHQGTRVTDVQLGRGEVLQIGSRLALLCVRRPLSLPASHAPHGFGEPDVHGFVGESPAAWVYRRARAGQAPGEGEPQLPALSARVEDIPLLLHRDQRFETGFYDPRTASPRVAPELVRHLVQHGWPGDLAELDEVLSLVVEESQGNFLDLGLATRARLSRGSA